ncbi:hypothetical protein BDZ89DRAFT_1046238 [Hymenopellis radicata]|nr:hypothetical protein BDZ89DRAFT_1046238 [Hymenopellis radicata]
MFGTRRQFQVQTFLEVEGFATLKGTAQGCLVIKYGLHAPCTYERARQLNGHECMFVSYIGITIIEAGDSADRREQRCARASPFGYVQGILDECVWSAALATLYDKVSWDVPLFAYPNKKANHSILDKLIAATLSIELNVDGFAASTRTSMLWLLRVARRNQPCTCQHRDICLLAKVFGIRRGEENAVSGAQPPQVLSSRLGPFDRVFLSQTASGNDAQ